MRLTATLALLVGGLLAGAAAQAQDGTAAPKGLTFSFDITPEYYASTSGSDISGDLADTVFKIGLAGDMPNGLTWAGTLSQTLRVPDSAGQTTSYNQAEAVLGYKWKVSPEVTIPVAGTLGYAFGQEPKIDPTDPEAPEAYYAITVGADWKVNAALTWNVVSARYRDAFGQDWQTPKLSTGVTYAIGPTGRVYADVGKSWKNTGTGYANDKYSIGFGIKYAF